jgi:hypothetical protein
MSSPGRDNEPEPMQLPRPSRTLLQGLALWLRHAKALRGWIAPLRDRLTGVMLWNVLMLGHLIESKTTTYGALGTAATLLLAFFLVGRVIVGAAVLNATLYGRHSRSLNTTPSPSPAITHLRGAGG